MTVGVRIRPAAPGDRPQLLALTRDLATSYDVDPASFGAGLDDVLVAPTSLLVVAERASVVVGYALAQLHHTVHANGVVVWVEEVMVDESSRAGGVGRALMTEIEAWGVRNGAAYVALATRRAEDFYRALGYEPSATYLKRVLPTRSPSSPSARNRPV